MIVNPQLRFLADVNIEKRVVDSLVALVAAGLDVKWVAEEDCSITDEALLDTVRNQRGQPLTVDRGKANRERDRSEERETDEV